ncbi:primary-amine oxidase [Labedaea rhizosphaerae]|uniref:Amine oxidase n=1 Tax=Labedaea rhizosphaerae TaxID=598644 RepID=A0A4R6SEA4_LABRH|nr:primary-amine oxidase [Labedaea rhizosphaerae]TDQ00222.1 primary-amine oxidase [Labedaea rhizosphaerae]
MNNPLEPLTADEIAATSAILKGAKGLGATVRFLSVELHEPSKRAVLDGVAAEREAFVVLRDRDSRTTIEAVVSLSRAELVSWREVPLAQPGFSRDEFAAADEVLRGDPAFREALQRRGITDLDAVAIDLWAAGNTGPAEDPARRLMRPQFYVRQGRFDNRYAHPIEGLTALVDIDRMEVVELVDHGVVAVPPRHGNYIPELVTGEIDGYPDNVPAFAAVRDDLRPVEITQPHGPSFTIDDHELRWQKWRMNIGYTMREGLVLHQVGYVDDGRVRPILYRASMSELYVPYGDPNPSQRVKNAFDIGEGGIGPWLNSLALGCDCLGEIRYLDVVMCDDDGAPVTLPNAICIHEEDDNIVWKHTDGNLGHVETRRQRRLVVSCWATANNYDYGFFWYFYVDGTIEFEVKLTGIVSTGAFEGDEPAFGTALAPGLYAPNHQHFFNMRLDMTVDGERNSVYEVDTVAVPGTAHHNAFAARPRLLARESEAQRIVDPLAGRYWTVVNPSVRHHTGRPVGYKLAPGENILPLAQDGSQTSRRAGFAYRHLWVTAYDPAQRYASGDYPNQRPHDDGLAVYAQADRPLEDTDVVVWYTFGANHVPRPEDWPVMPVSKVGFHLKPVAFFAANPALDLPRPGHHC